MKKIRILLVNLVLVFVVLGFVSLTTFAEPTSPVPVVPGTNASTTTASESPDGTILPATSKSVRDCKDVMNTMNTAQSDAIDKFKSNKAENQGYINEILACGIKTGSIRLWMLPYYIRYILQFIVGLSGLIAVGGIIYGGYLYLFAGIADDKDKGKKAIEFGIIGLVLTLIAWAIVNIVISVVSG